jgi:hypothetical protein
MITCACGRSAKNDKLSSPQRPYADGKGNRPIDIKEAVLYDNKRGYVNLCVPWKYVPSFALNMNLIHTQIKAKLRYKHSIVDNSMCCAALKEGK